MDGANFNREERQPYLKCSYVNGMAPNEYIIKFTTTESTAEENPLLTKKDGKTIVNASGLENLMFVNMDNVVTIDEEKGLMLISGVYKSNSEKSLVGIANIDGISRRYIPNSEIVWR